MDGLFIKYILLISAQYFLRPYFMGWNNRFKTFSKHAKGLFLSNSEKDRRHKKNRFLWALLLWDDSSTWPMWHIKTLIQQHDYYTGMPWLVHDVFSCKGVCNQHADSGIVHQSCCTWMNWMLISLGKPGFLLEENAAVRGHGTLVGWQTWSQPRRW